MNRNNDLRREFVATASGRTKVQPRPMRHEPNHPVPVEEFARESMGLAAKE